MTDSPHVLIVDDMAVNRMILDKVLSRLGCRTDAAADGREAVEKSAVTDYDFIFMDCNMPEMDGFEATHAIRVRALGQQERPVIVALTADGLTGDRERCLSAGMNDYLAKPFTPEQVDNLLKKWEKTR